MANIGFSDGIQSKIKPGTIIASKKNIGLDGLLNYYAGRNIVCDLQLEKSFTDYMQWNPIKGSPYVVTTEEKLLNQIAQDDFICGYTVSSIGFYAPQGRGLRHSLDDDNFREKLASFEYEGCHICNIDMESASITGLAALLGHRAISCCIVDDVKQNSLLGENNSFKELVRIVLDRI